MTCGFCGSRNGDEEHRCRKCGRRPGDTLTGEVALHRTQGQLAMQVEVRAVEMPARKEFGRPYQASLFQAASNVIPIESYAPVEPRPRQQRTESTAAKTTRAPRRPKVAEGQGSLDFLASAPLKPRTLGTTVEAVIFCDAPVAVKLHRAVASALDWAMVLIAYGAFLVVFCAMGGSITFNKPNMMVFGGVLLLFASMYGLMWTLGGGETMGMHWTRLKLVTFDGFPPDKRQRVMRFVGSFLGMCTIIGLAWSLVDEEGLGWQDHMSRTFPTPREAENMLLVRR
jgi:uncharacterized RDD family membrane protein YckC